MLMQLDKWPHYYNWAFDVPNNLSPIYQPEITDLLPMAFQPFFYGLFYAVVYDDLDFGLNLFRSDHVLNLIDPFKRVTSSF